MELFDRPFLPRDAVLARYMLSSCVRLSIRPLHAGIVQKWINAGSHKLRHTIAPRLFLVPKISAKFQRVTWNGGAK